MKLGLFIMIASESYRPNTLYYGERAFVFAAPETVELYT